MRTLDLHCERTSPKSLCVGFFAALMAVGCAPSLKAGTDRAETGTVERDSGSNDSAVSDASERDGGRLDAQVGEDTGVDSGTVSTSTVQTSCPDTHERGCGLTEVRGGSFDMGMNPVAQGTPLDGAPVQPGISVGDFAMDTYEVTVARFRRFWAVAAGVPRVTSIRYPGGVLPVAQGPREPDPTTTMWPECNWTSVAGARELHPINCVDWYTAQAFCVWDGGRLPTDAEWEYTARGRVVGELRAGRVFPWGDDLPGLGCERARWRYHQCPGKDGAQTRQVGSFAATPETPTEGIYDLAGNILEWTADHYTAYDNSNCWAARATGRHDPLCLGDPTGPRVLRGGSWYFDTANILMSATRTSTEVSGPLVFIGAGFRCARSRH